MTPSTRLDAVIFDMDGLLIDSERVIMQAWLDAARDEDIALDADGYGAVIGRSGADAIAVMTAVLGGEAAFRAVRARAQARLAPGAVFPLKHGAPRLLSALREAGVRCAVASSSSAAEIRHRLDAVGVLRHFDAWAGGDEVPRGKPDPAVYRLAAGRLGVPAERCLAFEDSENGTLAALAAGARVVVVPDLRVPRDEIAARAIGVLGSLAEAIDHLPRWFPGRIDPRS